MELYFPVFMENNIILMEKTSILLVFLCCNIKRFAIRTHFIVNLAIPIIKNFFSEQSPSCETKVCLSTQQFPDIIGARNFTASFRSDGAVCLQSV